MSRRVAAIFGLGGLAGLLALLALGGPARNETNAPIPRRAPDPRFERHHRPGNTPAKAAAREAYAKPRAPLLPESLAGSEPDGALSAGTDGALLPTAGLRRRFDYFLTASGELSPAELRALLAASLSGPAQARGAALALFDRYVAYLEALSRLPEPAGLHAGLSARHALQAEYFDPEVCEAFFGAENAEAAHALAAAPALAAWAEPPDRHALEGPAIEGPDPMTPGELSPAIRAARRESLAPLRSLAEEEALRQLGAGPEALASYRAAHFGPEAASRLAALDARDEEWRQRIESYRAERAALAGLPPEARRRAEQALLERHFEPLERRRVEVLTAHDAP